MFVIEFGIFFVVLFTVVSCEPPYYDKIDEIPPFFKKEDFDRCGLTGNLYRPLMRQPPKFECSKYLCLFGFNDLLNTDLSVNNDAVQSLLDQYTARNQSAAAKMRQVSRHCLAAPVDGTCEADELLHCMLITYSLGYLTGNYLMPAKCRSTPEGEKAHACCSIPPLFKEYVFEGCGFWKGRVLDGTGMAVAPDHYKFVGCNNRTKYPTIPCPNDLCLINKHGLVSGDGKLKPDAVKRFLDDFAGANPTYNRAVDEAKKKCALETAPGPGHVCEAQKLIHCVTTVLAHECPTW